MKQLSFSHHLKRLQQVAAVCGIVLFAGCLVRGSGGVPVAQAVSSQDQINALQRENETNRNAVANLQNEARSYQDAISRLQSQIALIQGQIAHNTAKQEELQQKIEAGQRELDHQRKVLGENIRVMYTEGQITTIEMLATSKNLSDFVDKEEYRTAVERKIQDTLAKIAKLQNELKEQQVQVARLLEEQTQQRNQLAGAQAEQNKLLSYNQTQQADFNNRTKANDARIAALIAEQRRAVDTTKSFYFLRFPGAAAPHNPNVDDYPYANAGFSMSTAPGCVDNDGPDEWGYCTRQCVSYAAWAVERSGRSAPYYYGNAKDWVQAAAWDGVPVYTSNPQPGDVAISTAGTWGHAMYVEAVSGNQILVSQYNQQFNGRYSTQWRTWQ